MSSRTDHTAYIVYGHETIPAHFNYIHKVLIYVLMLDADRGYDGPSAGFPLYLPVFTEKPLHARHLIVLICPLEQ